MTLLLYVFPFQKVFIKQKFLEDADEFINRVLYLDPTHVKALSRKAFIITESGNNPEEALKFALKAQKFDKNSTPDLVAQVEELTAIVSSLKETERVQMVAQEALNLPNIGDVDLETFASLIRLDMLLMDI